MLELSLISALGIICAWLWIHRIVQARHIREITKVLAALRSDRELPLLHIRTGSPALNELAEQVNFLRDHLLSVGKRTEQLENIQRQVMTHIAHDLRTPLTSLSGYAELLKSQQLAKGTEMEKYADIIVQKSRKLTEIIRNFFEWARLESNDMPLQFQKVDMTKKVEEAMLSFLQQFEQAGVQPILELPKERLSVWADPASIDRILHNLISNSLKYGGEGGKHGIKLWKKRGRVWVEVWDCGRGIEPEHLPFIFDRLYKGGRSGRYDGGSGLGLSITKKLIDKHQGEIFVRSVPYERTSFIFGI
ncbi:sensor histidine kinase [Aneurinibacillus aneurinilyticus]|jgi:signal transduction histidine kinase|uniref:sensor histidine kinase n=1 Tax=Aneurinibacillus aneurinilyticus TaxID=1391 RepID=UPI0023F2255A|nr:HAMP domain-containing sensor histidine kinase [Aneurinibacillus aneurinilyticus]MED0670730.1 HAMP domain-containing sensor histidine kinase [Aneurinibacillus aneurinilyticus]